MLASVGSAILEMAGPDFDEQLYFRQRAAFGRDECCNNGTFHNRGEHTAVRKARPFQSEAGLFAGLFVVAKCRLHRKPRERTQIRICFLEIHALEAAGFLGREFNGSGAIDEHFASFALRIFKTEKWRIHFVAVIDFSMEIRN